jgi:hypothetical protein
LIAFNNLTSKINANDIIDKQAFYNKLSKCISLLSLDIALAVASTFTLAASLMVEGGTAWYIILGMPIAFLGIITGLLVRSALYKKYGVTCFDISPEKQKYRKKYNKITAICFFVIVLLNLAAPLVDAMLNSNVSYYTFADGYYYETIEDAERDYYKVKNHITGDKKLYDEDWCEGQYAETGEYILEVTEIKYEFDYDEKKGYDFLDLRYVDYKTFTFKTEEEREQFKEEFEKENVYKNDGLSIDMLKKGVEFDDENLTIKYEQRFRMSGVYDVMPVSILLIFCEVLVVLIVMTIVYKKKTKNL